LGSTSFLQKSLKNTRFMGLSRPPASLFCGLLTGPVSRILAKNWQGSGRNRAVRMADARTPPENAPVARQVLSRLNYDGFYPRDDGGRLVTIGRFCLHFVVDSTGGERHTVGCYKPA